MTRARRRARRCFAAAAVGLVVAAARPAVSVGAERPLVLLVGDSTTQGVCEGCPAPPAVSPAGALELLRRRLPAGSRWRELRALSVGVGGSTSGDWVAVRPEVCRLVAGRDVATSGRATPDRATPDVATPGVATGDLGLRVLSRACERKTGLASAAREVVGEMPTLVLIVLGANDVMGGVTPEVYLANLRAIAAGFAPARALVATPFWSPQPARARLAAYARAVRAAGLLRGPDFYAVHLPVDGSLVHLTAGGYAAAAGLWLDELPP